MVEKEAPPPEKKGLGIKDIARVIRKALVPVSKPPVRSPTSEQSKQVESALRQSLGEYAVALIYLFANKYIIEYSNVDTRPEKRGRPKNARFINLTGAWGRAPECVAEVNMLATAMGKLGLFMDLISLPGHGETDDLPAGWGAGKLGEDFDVAADIVGAHILETSKESPETPVVINAWSMGGVTALKTAAKYPELVDGLILVDTPVFPQNFKKLALRFMLYELQKLRTVRSEKPFDIDVDDPGLGIFITRIRDRNKSNGISFKVLKESAKSLAKQNLIDDGTLDKIAENAKEKNMPIIILRGSNDYVIPHDQTTMLSDELEKRGVKVVIETVKEAGHGVILEHPIESGEIVREWLEENELVEKEV